MWIRINLARINRTFRPISQCDLVKIKLWEGDKGDGSGHMCSYAHRCGWGLGLGAGDRPVHTRYFFFFVPKGPRSRGAERSEADRARDRTK